MRARVVPATQGVRWLASGWQLFRAAPLAWLAVSFAYVFVTQLVAVIPVIGPLIGLTAVPALTLGLMACARAAVHGDPPSLPLLAEGWRQQPRGLLVLGAVYLACSFALFGATALADQGGVLRAVLRGRAAEPDFDALAAPVAVFALIATPVTLAFWFAPALVGWHSLPVLKALFFSLVAGLMNWRAFLAYGAACALLGFLPAAALYALAAASGRAVDAWTVALPLALLLLPTFLASFYASYHDVFGYHSAP